MRKLSVYINDECAEVLERCMVDNGVKLTSAVLVAISTLKFWMESFEDGGCIARHDARDRCTAYEDIDWRQVRRNARRGEGDA